MPNNREKVEIREHDPQWVSAFRQDAADIGAVFGREALAIHHIGSTSVPGLAAKPIIDILLEVEDINRVELANDQMRALGYESLGEYGLSRRRYFRKITGDKHLVHVHTWQAGDVEIDRHISFRDYLIAHREAAAAYGRLKMELLKRFNSDKERYMDGKDSLIKDLERRALAWRRVTHTQTIETERMRLLPLNRAELWQYLNRPGQLEAALKLRLSRSILTETVKQAIRAKLRKMDRLPLDRLLWHTYWLAVKQDDSFGAGLIGFKGVPRNGEVEIGYGIDSTVRRQGYTTEAAGALVRWALAQSDCSIVCAATEKANVASIRVLEKLDFSMVRETDEEFYWLVSGVSKR